MSLFFNLACGGGDFLSDSSFEEDQMLDQVQQNLSHGNCADAFDQLNPWYASARSNNRIRTTMASVYACYLGVTIEEVLMEASQVGSPQGVFSLAARLFPSTTQPIDDRKPLFSALGMEAIFSVLKKGVILHPSYSLKKDPFNPGSLFFQDREDLANASLFLLSLGLMGSLQSRYGVPDAQGNKTQNLPWTTVGQMPGEGCAFVAGVMNFQDSLAFLSTEATRASMRQAYLILQTAFQLGLDTACIAGCTACGLVCNQCPGSMQDRDACLGVGTDLNSCAGVEIVNFVNATW